MAITPAMLLYFWKNITIFYRSIMDNLDLKTCFLFNYDFEPLYKKFHHFNIKKHFLIVIYSAS